MIVHKLFNYINMSIRKFVATALLTVAAVTGSAVEAQPGGQRLFDSLDRAGVSYSSGDCEKHGMTGVYGFYVAAKHHIHICTDVATTDSQQWQTLRHEAVHAAQRCVNPSMAFTVTSSQFLMENGRQSDWELIQSAYDREDWAIELEAFTLMRLSNGDIADLVDAACN